MIPLSIPELGGNEWKYIKQALDDNWVSSVGPFVGRFEEEVARVAGMSHAVATVNGTSAIHATLVALGVGSGDAVLVPALTFVGTVNPIRYCGAEPVFIDAEPVSWNLDPEALKRYLSEGAMLDREHGCWRDRQTGRRLRAIIPVHLYGHPADMDPILEMADRFGLDVVEDATEAIGAKYKGRPVGGLGRAGCFSFNGNKVITTGGGGMVVTADRALADRVRYLTTQARDDAREYVHHEVGFNYRLTNLQAALGLAQIERLPEFLVVKRRHARQYAKALATVPGVAPQGCHAWAESTHWLFSVRVQPGTYGCDRSGLIDALERAGIQSRPLFRPIHLQPPYRGSPVWSRSGSGGALVAEAIYAEGVNLPSSVGLTEADVDRVCRVVARRTGDGELEARRQAAAAREGRQSPVDVDT